MENLTRFAIVQKRSDFFVIKHNLLQRNKLYDNAIMGPRGEENSLVFFPLLQTENEIYRMIKTNRIYTNNTYRYNTSMQDIYSLNATPKPYTFSSWQINSDENFDFGFTIQDNRISAIILGLICALAHNCHLDDYRVIIDNQNS